MKNLIVLLILLSSCSSKYVCGDSRQVGQWEKKKFRVTKSYHTDKGMKSTSYKMSFTK